MSLQKINSSIVVYRLNTKYLLISSKRQYFVTLLCEFFDFFDSKSYFYILFRLKKILLIIKKLDIINKELK